MGKSAALLVLLVLYSALAYAGENLAVDLNEKVVKVPVDVKYFLGQKRLFLETTIFKPDGNGPFPLLVLNHGTPKIAERRGMKRSRYLAQSREFVKMGFVVAIPMRRGYGDSDGQSLTTPCSNPQYHQFGIKDATDLLATVDYMKKEPYVDGKHIVLAGQSGGGFASLACGSVGFDGLVAIISFAGGMGAVRKDEVCSESDLISAMGRYAKSCRVPTLWIYSENDHHFCARLVKNMHDAYLQAGGQAKLVMMPSFGEDGHYLFSNKAGIRFWLPEVKSFLKPCLQIKD